jgi:hypothetical protein
MKAFFTSKPRCHTQRKDVKIQKETVHTIREMNIEAGLKHVVDTADSFYCNGHEYSSSVNFDSVQIAVYILRHIYIYIYIFYVLYII